MSKNAEKTERPILFNPEMVRAILEGRKTQTRRVIKPQPLWVADPDVPFKTPDADPKGIIYCPYGKRGSKLWVRETFWPIYPQDPNYNGGKPIEYDYYATYEQGYRLGDSIGIKKKWKPAIHMPRAASRITLEIIGIRVERLQDISESDAIAEGIKTDEKSRSLNARDAFSWLWESIKGSGSWGTNPWVWVIEFRRSNDELQTN